MGGLATCSNKPHNLRKQVFRKVTKVKARRGFTLIEVLLVVLILAVLASIVIPRIAESTADAKKARCASNIANLICALELYAIKNDGAYPADQDAFDSLILNSTTYFPHGTPECPFGAAANPYVYVNTAGQETVTKHNHP